MNVTYFCHWYLKAISAVSDVEKASCAKGGRHCVVCKDCRLRRLDEVNK